MGVILLYYEFRSSQYRFQKLMLEWQLVNREWMTGATNSWRPRGLPEPDWGHLFF